MHDTDDVLGLVLPQGYAGMLAFQYLVDDLLGGIVDVDRLHLGAMDHDVEHLQAPEIEHAAEHRRIALGDGAADGLQLDGAADLLVRRQDVGRVVALGGCQPQDQADDELDRRGQRTEERDDDPHDRRHEQRHAVGESQRVGLGQHRREDDDEQRHDRRRVDDAGGANHHDGDAGGERGRQDVDEGVAEQHGADHFGGLAQQPIDEAGLRIALLLQRVHARARGRGERRLAGVEERRQHEQHDDGEEDGADFEDTEFDVHWGSREVFTAYCGQPTLARQCRNVLAEPGGRIRNLIARLPVSGLRRRRSAGPGNRAPLVWTRPA